MRKAIGMFLFSILLHAAFIVAAADRYVATTGNDDGPGSIDSPWRTIQHAAERVSAGDSVHIRAGTYSERVEIKVSGSVAEGAITFRNYGDESVILDGTSIVPGEGSSALLWIENQSDLMIQGIEIANYRTNEPTAVPIGVFITGKSQRITLKNLNVHHIEQNSPTEGDGHGIAVYGTDGSSSIDKLVIDGCTVANCKLGSSEALVLNGNVENFEVTNNIVHDCNNIGIDLIGWENTAPANDQVRNGVVRGNTVFNISSYGNPAYGDGRSAAGIYVDGGKDMTIERNTVHHCDFGIEIGCEHGGGKTTAGITVRNNLFYRNDVAGIAFGGYDTKRGIVTDCTFEHNTLFENDATRSANGEIMIQQANGNALRNNLIFTNSQKILVSNYFKISSTYNIAFDYNLYYANGGGIGVFIYQEEEYSGLAAFQTGTGQDSHSQFADPLLADPVSNPPVLVPGPGSPAIDTGDPTFAVAPGETDFAGKNRIVNGITDCGAYERQAAGTTFTVTASVSPPDSGTVSGSGVYDSGTTVTLTALPTSGYRFGRWEGDLTGTSNPVSFLIDSDMACVAVFESVPFTPGQMTIGSILEIAASEVEADWTEFEKKTKIFGICRQTVKVPFRVVTTKFPGTSVVAQWRKKILLYDKKSFKGKRISDVLEQNPVESLTLDGLFISAMGDGANPSVSNMKLDRTVILEPPTISVIEGSPSKEGDPFTIRGKWFGSRLPKVMVEYLKNGDPLKPKYKKCVVDFDQSAIYRDASGNPKNSCMKIWGDDSVDSEIVGNSLVVAEYPALRSTDQATGYLILENGIGIDAKPSDPLAAIRRCRSGRIKRCSMFFSN